MPGQNPTPPDGRETKRLPEVTDAEWQQLREEAGSVTEEEREEIRRMLPPDIHERLLAALRGGEGGGEDAE